MTPAINPPAVSILRGDVMPPHGGDTQWADMVAAYNDFSPTFRAFLDTLRAVHLYQGNAGTDTTKEYQETLNKNRIVSEHPLIRVHPETGEKSLYISPSFIKNIVGLTPTESDRILNFLKEHASRPEYTVRFKWESGSIAMWDNRHTTHMGPRDVINSEFPREVHRTTLMGDIPVGVDGRESTPLEGNPIKPI
ncbi:MAG: TauD/TfdA dioxygenase family protein [Rhodospirillales bacterium]